MDRYTGGTVYPSYPRHRSGPLHRRYRIPRHIPVTVVDRYTGGTVYPSYPRHCRGPLHRRYRIPVISPSLSWTVTQAVPYPRHIPVTVVGRYTGGTVSPSYPRHCHGPLHRRYRLPIISPSLSWTVTQAVPYPRCNGPRQ